MAICSGSGTTRTTPRTASVAESRIEIVESSRFDTVSNFSVGRDASDPRAPPGARSRNNLATGAVDGDDAVRSGSGDIRARAIRRKIERVWACPYRNARDDLICGYVKHPRITARGTQAPDLLARGIRAHSRRLRLLPESSQTEIISPDRSQSRCRQRCSPRMRRDEAQGAKTRGATQEQTSRTARPPRKRSVSARR